MFEFLKWKISDKIEKTRSVCSALPFQMTSRYFIRTFRRLFLLSSSHIPLVFRNKRLLWTSLGTATVVGTTFYKTSPFESLIRPFIVHAKSLEKDLSPTGMI